MARIRSVKPEFAKSETIAALPRDVRLHFMLLWTYADDDGRGVDNPKLIKAELWPLDDDVTATVVEGWQAQLAEHGRIVRYEADGRHFFEVVNFAEHQHPQKKGESKYPPPSSGTPIEPLPEDYATATGELPPVVVVVGEGSFPAPPDGDAESRAVAVASEHWNAGSTTPVISGGKVALVKLCERFLTAGHSERELLAALNRTRAYTNDAVTFSLTQTNGNGATTTDRGTFLPGTGYIDKTPCSNDACSDGWVDVIDDDGKAAVTPCQECKTVMAS